MRQTRNRPLHPFLIRYIKLLVLAFVGYLVVYFSFFAVMEYQALRKRQEASALNAKIYLDTVLNNMVQAGYQLRSGGALGRVIHSPLAAEPYDYVEAYQEISRLTSQIDLLDSCYVYIIPTQTVLASNYGMFGRDGFYDGDLLRELEPWGGIRYLAHIPEGLFAPSGGDYLVQVTRLSTTVRSNAGLVCMNLSRPRLGGELEAFVEESWLLEVRGSGMELFGVLPEDASSHFLATVPLNHGDLEVTVAVRKGDFYREMAAGFLRSTLLFLAFAGVVGLLLATLLSAFTSTFRSIVIRLAGHYTGREASEFGLQDLGFYFGKLVDDNKAYAARLRETAHVVQEKLLSDLLLGNLAEEAEFERMCRYMDVRFPHSRFLAACIDVDGREAAASPAALLRAKTLIKEALERRGDPVIYVALECGGTAGAVVNYGGSGEEVRRELAALAEELRERLDKEELNLFATFSGPVSREELPAAYAKARYNLGYKYLPSKQCVFFDDNPGPEVGNLIPGQLSQLVLSAVNSQTYTAIYGAIRDMAAGCGGEEEEVAPFRAKLLVLCGLILDSVGRGSSAARLREHGAAVSRLGQAEGVDGLCTAFFSFLGGISRDVSQRGHPYNVNRYISKAVDFISASFDREISVGDIAEHLNLNPKYFSRLFKEHTGMTVMQFLSDLRMKRASDLLLEGGRTVREVGELVGFSDSRSFIRHFKRCYGVTPGEYRTGPLEGALPEK